MTLALTAVVLFTADETLGSLSDLVAITIGLVGTAIALQLEILFRIGERSRSRERFNSLLEGIEDFPDLLPIAAEILGASVETLRTAQTEGFRQNVFRTLARSNIRLQELAQGRLRADGSDNTLVLERFEQTETLLQGTTDAADTTWWRSADGQRFLELSRRLITRGVAIERIWLLSAPPSQIELELMAEHAKAGVQVFVVRTDGGRLDKALLVNLTLMDGSFLQQDVPNKEGHAVEYLYSENTADIDRAVNVVAQLKSKATAYTGPEALSPLFPESEIFGEESVSSLRPGNELG